MANTGVSHESKGDGEVFVPVEDCLDDLNVVWGGASKMIEALQAHEAALYAASREAVDRLLHGHDIGTAMEDEWPFSYPGLVNGWLEMSRHKLDHSYLRVESTGPPYSLQNRPPTLATEYYNEAPLAEVFGKEEPKVTLIAFLAHWADLMVKLGYGVVVEVMHVTEDSRSVSVMVYHDTPDVREYANQILLRMGRQSPDPQFRYHSFQLGRVYVVDLDKDLINRAQDRMGQFPLVNEE
jgi:hypothetical protein